MRLLVVTLLVTYCSAAARRGGGGGARSHGGGSHSYPHSTGYSGTSSGGSYSYPHSNGLSGNSRGYNTHGSYNSASKTEVHHHYHYSPPQQISYGSTYHPVYHGSPPVYIYEYRDSGSRFDNLLTGLALYNLGRMSANNHHYNNYDSQRHYSGTPGEICKLGISKQTGDYEETRIDCMLMSSFIFEASTSQSVHHVEKTKSVVTTVTNQTHSGDAVAGGSNTSVTSVSVKTETVKEALHDKGPSIAVTPGMICYMIKINRDTTILKRNVECGLLQEYARRSMRPNSSERLTPMLTIMLNFILFYLFSY